MPTMPDSNDVESRVARVIAERLGVDAAKVVPGATLESLGADSLSTVEIAMDLEDEFGVYVEIGPLKMVTVGDWTAMFEDFGGGKATR